MASHRRDFETLLPPEEVAVERRVVDAAEREPEGRHGGRERLGPGLFSLARTTGTCAAARSGACSPGAGPAVRALPEPRRPRRTMSPSPPSRPVAALGAGAADPGPPVSRASTFAPPDPANPAGRGPGREARGERGRGDRDAGHGAVASGLLPALLTAFLTALLLAALPARSAGQQGDAIRSPTLRALWSRAARASGDSLDTDPFWRDVAARATPLVEPLPGTDSVLVTFLWRGNRNTRNALVFGDLTGWLAPANETERLPGTDVWYLSVPSTPDVHFRYRIAENDSRRIYWRDPDFRERVRRFRPDPLNPDTVLLAAGQPGSRVEGPAFLHSRWTPAREPRGGTRDTLVLGRRRVPLYLPPGAEAAGAVGVVVALDGGAYDALVSTPATVETLAGEGVIPPVVVALVGHLDRTAELAPNAAFVHFVADTLFPALEARHPVSSDPARSVVVGSSLGGLAALHLAFRLPERFGSAVAQSGAYWWAPPGDDGGPWMSRLLAAHPSPRLRVYLDAGSLERHPVRGGASMLRLTQQLRDVLCARGDEVAYRTFPGGHFYEAWRVTLPGALRWALGDARRDEPELQGCGDLVPRAGGGGPGERTP